MTFTLAQLKTYAAASGAELLILHPGAALPAPLRGKRGKELWLCAPAGIKRKIIYAALSRFDKVYIFNKQEAR